MPTPSWWQKAPRVLIAALPVVLLACSPGTDPSDPDNGSAAGNGGGGSLPSGGAAGAALGGANVSGTPATGTSGSGVVGTGGSPATTGGTGASSGAGGTTPGTGGVVGTAGSVSDACATVTCGAGQTCSGGSCKCTTGMLCSAACVDTQNDANNCGGCGTKCASDGACVSGACVNPMCNPDTQTRNGHVTHYTLATPMVACHWPTDKLPQYYGAMNEYDWNTAGVCGACVEITNGGSKLVVQIVDQCPYKGNEQWCFQGSHHIDLNNAANGALNASGNPAVSWKFVSCTPMGNIQYYFDKAVQQYYLAVSPLNYRNPIAKMEVKKADAFTPLTRNTNNMFELTMGAGVGALTFRLTDIYNHVVTDTVMMSAGQTVTGSAQFAACP
jgi:expansin